MLAAVAPSTATAYLAALAARFSGLVCGPLMCGALLVRRFATLAGDFPLLGWMHASKSSLNRIHRCHPPVANNALNPQTCCGIVLPGCCRASNLPQGMLLWDATVGLAGGRVERRSSGAREETTSGQYPSAYVEDCKGTCLQLISSTKVSRFSLHMIPD